MKVETAQFEASFGLSSQLPPCSLPEIAFSGRSNVGKSSLLNKILNRKSLARVSGVPGKTITINFFRLSNLRLVDLPGYGYARRSGAEQQRWSQSIEHYFQSGRDVRLVVQLLDMRHAPSQDDWVMLDFLKQMDYRFAVALTKCDKLSKNQRLERLSAMKEDLREFSDIPIVEFSALTGQGVEEIRQLIDLAVM